MNLYHRTIGEGGVPLLILHGLLGSHDNWMSIARVLSGERKVILCDARNHGRSPHSDKISYAMMAEDVLELLRETGHSKVHLLGHSMGGKTAMYLSLTHPGVVDHLVVADIAPRSYSGNHKVIFRAMLDAPVGQLGTREAVEEHLKTDIPSAAVRLFIMKNLGRHEDGSFFWKPNLDALQKNYPLLMGFPALPLGASFFGPTLFLRGQLSDYVTPADEEEVRQIFPAARIMTLPDAGHWLHAEQPEKFTEALRQFLP